MGTVLKQALPAPAAQPAAAPVNPYDAMLQQQLQELAAMDKQPQVSPEVIAQKRAANQREYELGMLGVLSDNEQLKGAGGLVLKNALAARQPHVTERGTADLVTGEYNYDPDYLRQQKAQRVQAIMQLQAAAALKMDADERHANLLREIQRMKGQQAVNVHVGNEPLVQTQGPDGTSVWTPRSQAAGMQAPPKGSGQPSEGERKAGSLLQRLEFSQKQLQQAISEDPSAATGGVVPQMAGQLPVVGDYASTQLNSPTRQRIENAQLDILDAALTLGTGAAYTREQLKGYAKSYFVQPGETDPKVISDKNARLNNVIQAAKIAAGRAAQGAGAAAGVTPAPGATPAAADPNDPHGVRRALLGK